MQTQTVFTGYDKIEGTSKKTGKPYKFFLFTDTNDKKFKVWEQSLVNELAGTRGQQVTVEYEERGGNGDYPPDKVVTKLLANSGVNTTNGSQQQKAAPDSAWTPNAKDKNINRQTAWKCASWLCAAGVISKAKLVETVDKIAADMLGGDVRIPQGSAQTSADASHPQSGTQPASPLTADSAEGSAEPSAAGSIETPDWLND